MLTDGIRWRKVDDPHVAALVEGALVRSMVKGRAICFVRTSGVLRALADVCPHQGKSFIGGRCEDGQVVCPWHRMRFDVVTGNNVQGSTSNATVFPVDERVGGIYIGLPYTSVRVFGIKLW